MQGIWHPVQAALYLVYNFSFGNHLAFVVYLSFILGGILMMFILREWLGILWLALIGWFLQNAASASYRQTQWHKALHEFTVSQVMLSDYAVFPPNITVSELIQRYILHTGHRFFLVATEERFTRVLILHNIKSVSQHSL